MTQAMRVYALSLGVRETNTLDRLAGGGRARDCSPPPRSASWATPTRSSPGSG